MIFIEKFLTEINEEEEAAMCLLMLSWGVKNWDEFNFEYSENSLCEETLQLSKAWKIKKLREKLDLSNPSKWKARLILTSPGTHFGVDQYQLPKLNAKLHF